MGEEQRKWLEKEVLESEAEYTVIAAGIQMLTDDRLNEAFYDRTKDFLVKLSNPKTSKKKS